MIKERISASVLCKAIIPETFDFNTIEKRYPFLYLLKKTELREDIIEDVIKFWEKKAGDLGEEIPNTALWRHYTARLSENWCVLDCKLRDGYYVFRFQTKHGLASFKTALNKARFHYKHHFIMPQHKFGEEMIIQIREFCCTEFPDLKPSKREFMPLGEFHKRWCVVTLGSHSVNYNFRFVDKVDAETGYAHLLMLKMQS